MAERVLGVVGREVVVVEPASGPPARGVAPARLEAQPDLAGHVRCVSSTNASSARISGECHRPS